MSVYTILHFILMAGTTILLLAAIITSRKKAGTGWLSKHRTLAIAAVAAGLVGVLVMFFYKTSIDHSHLKSPHAIGGLLTIIIILITTAAGQLLVSGRQFLRQPHRILGYATGAMAVITSFFGLIRLLQIMEII